MMKSKADAIVFDIVEKMNTCPSKFVMINENTGIPFLFTFENEGRNNPCLAA